MFGDEGTIEFVNVYLCEALGYTTDELIGQKLDRVLTLSSRLFYQTHFFPLLRLNGKVSEIFFMLRSKAGESIPVMVNATRDANGEKAINLAIFIIVWERQKYESEILESKKKLQNTFESNEVLKNLQTQLEENQQKLDRQIAALTPEPRVCTTEQGTLARFAGAHPQNCHLSGYGDECRNKYR